MDRKENPRYELISLLWRSGFNGKPANLKDLEIGAGPHCCLGSYLARIELNILYEERLVGLPAEFRIDPAKPPY